MAPSKDRIVLCMKWGTLYGAEYVNVLYHAARAHLTGDFRFVCMTDDATGIEPQVEILPIPDVGLPQKFWKAGAWPKLTVFGHQPTWDNARVLFVDLDTVICGPMDDLFEVEGALAVLDSRPWRYKEGAPRTMTSIFAFDGNKTTAVLERFLADMEGMHQKHDNEQDYIHGEFKTATGQEIRYWPEEWIRSFKYHLRQPLILDRFKHPKAPQAPARILCFHGNPRPIDLIRPPAGNWDVFPHYGKGQVPWMVDYWTRFGGKV